MMKQVDSVDEIVAEMNKDSENLASTYPEGSAERAFITEVAGPTRKLIIEFFHKWNKSGGVVPADVGPAVTTSFGQIIAELSVNLSPPVMPVRAAILAYVLREIADVSFGMVGDTGSAELKGFSPSSDTKHTH